MKKIFLISVIAMSSFWAISQEVIQEVKPEVSPNFKKNSVTFDIWHVAGVVNFNYERYWNTSFFGAKEIGFKAGYTNGSWAHDYYEDSYGAFLFGYNHVFTKNHKHALVVNIDITPFTPNVLLGLGSAWRYQSKKGFVLKVGLGVNNSPVIPMSFITSIGWSF